jgi:hypothetical protein
MQRSLEQSPVRRAERPVDRTPFDFASAALLLPLVGRSAGAHFKVTLFFISVLMEDDHE